MAVIEVGDKIPDFSLPVDGGGKLSNDDFSGRPFVLYFYPSDGTATCTAEAIGFARLKPEFDAIGVDVIGVSPDAVGKHDRFKAKHSLPQRLLADESRSAIEAFGVWSQKVLFGRRYLGVVRTTFLVDADGRIVEVWRKVRVPGHADKVLEAARRL